MKLFSGVVLICVSLSLFLSGCASIHDGNYAVVEGSSVAKGKTGNRQTVSGLVVSGQEVKDLSSKYITQIDFTFENKSSKWIHVKSVKMDFGSPAANDAISFPVGADLEAWIAAARQNQAIKDYNFNLAMASVGAVGAGMSATKGPHAQKDFGNFALAGASAGLTVNSVRNELNSLELAKVVPESHILSSNFVIPPGMHAKKWVALYVEKPYAIPYVSHVNLEITTSDGKVEKLKLPFRVGSIAQSTWQKDHPDSESSRWEGYRTKRENEYARNSQTPDQNQIKKDYITELLSED